MKRFGRIPLLAFGLGLALWVVDGLVDAWFFQDLDVLEAIVTAVPAHEVYVRTSAWLVLVLFGLVVSRLLRSIEAGRRRAEELHVALAAGRRMNRSILGHTDVESLVDAALRVMTEELGYEDAWVLVTRAPDGQQLFRERGLGGVADELREHARAGDLPCLRDPLPCGEVRRYASDTDCQPCTRGDAEGCRRALSAALCYRGERFGVLTASVSEAITSRSGETRLFGEIADDLALGLHLLLSAEELRKSRDRLLRAQSVAHVGSWEFDLRAGVASATEEAKRIYGLEDGEWSIADVQRVPLPEYRAQLDTALAGLIERGEPYDVTFQIRRLSDGEIRTVRSLAVHDAQRQVVAGSLQDVTEAHRLQKELEASEKALRHREARYRLLAEHTLDVIWRMDLELRFEYVNPAVETVFGYAPHEYVGTLLEQHCTPEVFERLRGIVADGLQRPEVAKGLVLETELLHKQGHAVGVEVHAKIVYEAGRPIAIQGVSRDVSERIAAQRHHEQISALLRQSQKMEAVGRLAGGVAHDFNNMLGVILGYVDLIATQLPEDGSVRADLREIELAAQRSADLTRRLLAFSRKQTLEPRVLDLGQELEEQSKLLRRLIGEEIVFEVHVDPELWLVSIDPTHFGQILANLSANARDAIPGSGHVTVCLENIRFEADCPIAAGHASAAFVPAGDYVRLRYRDDGVGIDKDTLARIFEPFFTTKAEGRGTGLGLAMVYGITQQNEGFLTVDSDLDHGTCFTFYFPRCVSEPKSGLEESEAKSAPAATNGETLLLVEDELQVLRLAQRMLERAGYRVLVANSARDALDLSTRHAGRISLLITDVIMPHMNGKELEAELRKQRPELRSLFVSGYTANVLAPRGVLEPGLRLVPKPFSEAELLRNVRAALAD